MPVLASRAPRLLSVRHFGRLPRFIAGVAVVALLLAVPIGALAHEHPDQGESQCRICKVSGSEIAVVHHGTELPAPQDETGLLTDGVRLVPDPPAAVPGAPRAPPA